MVSPDKLCILQYIHKEMYQDKDLQLTLGAHLNIAWLDISKKSQAILPTIYKVLKVNAFPLRFILPGKAYSI